MFEFTSMSRIVINTNSTKSATTVHGILTTIQATAANLREQLLMTTGLDLAVVRAGSARAGDIQLTLLNTRNSALGDEGYRLDIGSHVEIQANTNSGIFYARQTILQILKRTSTLQTLPKGVATDYPAKPHRSVMLDAGRKYWQMDFLEDTIRRMGWHKLNILHMHLTEWNGFRLDSPRFPGLASSDGAYTRDDIDRLQQLGRENHVIILPEVDMPGHMNATTSWYAATNPGKSLGFTATDCDHLNLWGGNVRRGWTLNYANRVARDFAKDLISEFLPWFESPYFHIGADETEYSATCSEIVAWARAHTSGVAADVFPDFINEMNRHVKSLGKEMHIWNGYEGRVTISKLDSDVVVYVWTGGLGRMAQFVNAGMDVIYTPLSYHDGLYLTPGDRLYPNAGWFLNYDLPHSSRVRGHQISVWPDRVESVADRFFEIQLVRMRAVLAERLWGGARSKSSDLPGLVKRMYAIGGPQGVPLIGAHDGISKEDWSIHARSSELQSNPASNLIDMQAHYPWVSANRGYPQHVDIDLGHLYDITRIQALQLFRNLNTRTGDPVGIVDFYVSVDGSNWGTRVARETFPDAPPDFVTADLSTPVRGRYVRVQPISVVSGTHTTGTYTALSGQRRTGLEEVNVFGIPVTYPNPNFSLLYHFAFDEGTGTAIRSSRGVKTGTLVGPIWIDGRVGAHALRFDGLDDLVDLNVGDQTGDWTVALWAKRLVDADNTKAMNILTSEKYALSLQQFGSNDDRVGITKYAYGVNSKADLEFSYTAPLNTWVHLAFVKNTTGVKLYANGMGMGQINEPIDLPLDRIGGRKAYGSDAARDFVNGDLDDLKIYNTAMTTLQIKEIYDSYSYVPKDPSGSLVSRWTFDEGIGVVVSDSVGTHHGLREEPVWVPGRVGSNALRFDGTDDYVNVGAVDLSGRWSIAMWARREADVDDGMTIVASDSYALKLQQYGSTADQVGITQYGSFDRTFNYSAPLNTWVHLVFVGTPRVTGLYVNGVYRGRQVVGINLPRAWFGARVFDSGTLGDRLTGSLDDVRVYNTLLSGAQVTYLYGSYNSTAGRGTYGCPPCRPRPGA